MQEVDDYLMRMSDELLIKMCKELSDWHYDSSGCLAQDGEVRKFAQTYTDGSAFHAEKLILFEAQHRYEKIVKVLFTQFPGLYIR